MLSWGKTVYCRRNGSLRRQAGRRTVAPVEKTRNPVEHLQWLRLHIETETVMEGLFRDSPLLCGFSLDGELSAIDVTCSARLHGTTLAKLRDSIEEAVQDLLRLRPEARDLLCGRTFARRVH
jgi:hypothetical protein